MNKSHITEGYILQSGKYKILKSLSAGGFGQTFLAIHTSLDKQFIIKIPKSDNFINKDDYEKELKIFQKEGKALAKFSHENIVKVSDFFVEDSLPFLVMEYVEGETIESIVKNKGKLSQDKAVKYFKKISNALYTLHENDLIHCDIHPRNILLDRNEEPILIDFGSAKSVTPSSPSSVSAPVTANPYVPYEQAIPNPQNLDNRPKITWDIYALAATLYFAITGEQPIKSDSRIVHEQPLKSPKALSPELSDWLNHAILRGMELEPQHRPSSMLAWSNLLQPPTPPTKFEKSIHEDFPHRTQLKRVKNISKCPSTDSSRNKYRSSIKKNLSSSTSLLDSPWIHLTLYALGYMLMGISISSLASKDSVLVGTLVIAGCGSVLWALAWILVTAGEMAQCIVGFPIWSSIWLLLGGIAGSLNGLFSFALFCVWVYILIKGEGGARHFFWALLCQMAGSSYGWGNWIFSLGMPIVWILGGLIFFGVFESEISGQYNKIGFILLGVLLTGGAIGYFTAIKPLWLGFYIGLAVFAQLYFIAEGLINSSSSLKKNFGPFFALFGLALASIIGLILGGGLGWGLDIQL